VAKRKTSLADLTAADLAAESPAPNNVVTLQRDDAKRSRTAKHTSLYLHPNVRRAIQEIAFQYDKKPHDLYLEGIDLMLRQYGKPTTADLAGKGKK
jgi:hypothetical protein